MFIGVRRSSIFRGPLRYLIFGWLPAAVISSGAAFAHLCGHTGLSRIVFFTVWYGGMFAPALTAYTTWPGYGSEVRTAGCLPTVLGVSISGAVAALPLLIGLAAYLMLFTNRHSDKVMFVAIFSPPVAAVYGGIASIPAYYLGILGSRTVRRHAADGRVSPARMVGVVAGASVLGLLCINHFVSTARVSILLLLAIGPFMIFPVGSLWACTMWFGNLGWRAESGTDRLLFICGAVFSALFVVAAMLGLGCG